MEGDARTTRGIIGDAESRTSAGWVFRVVEVVAGYARLSWYILNSELTIESTLNISRHVTASVSNTLSISRYVLNSVSATLSISRQIWGFVSATLNVSRHVQNNVAATLDISRKIYDSLSGKIRVTFKAAKKITEYFGSGDQTGDKKKSRMR